MSKSKFNPLITASVMSAVYLAGVSNISHAVVATDQVLGLNAVVEERIDSQSQLPAVNALGQRRYIIQFNEQPVARYSGNGELAAIPRKSDNKIDASSPAVQAYVNHLKSAQQNFVQSLTSSLNRNVKQNFSYQYALNGVVLELTPAEANSVKSMPNVSSVQADLNYFLNTDAGPQLIGADNIWAGSSPASGTAFGEGVVVAILDSGTNFDHPALADVGADGYDHTNPLGAGNYLGVCDPSNADQFLATYTCNDKIIGGYDFINDITPANGFDIEGPEDEDGHGTHTSTTAVGNSVLGATVPGIIGMADTSGVARHANLVMFDTCFTPPPNEGGCSGTAAIASIDQILADGIVDVVNYSISGGTSPWTDPVSQAFLSATDSGVFIATSAGNSGPDPATLGHVEPWTASSGASTHTRGVDSPGMSITGPVIDPALEGLVYNTSNGPVALVDTAGGINYAGVVDAANFEGCNAFPASSFDGVVALISRGACSFADKIANATAAGAIAVVVHNDDRDDPDIQFGMNVGDMTTIPSFSISQEDGLAMAAYIEANAGSTVLIELPFLTVETPDMMAGFSSRGPSPFEYNKPDVTGPGVSVLAGWADSDPAIGTDAEFNIISGTSMSSPHTAGAAALLKELHPTWSAAEIKSALMLTAVTAGVTKEDGTTPADPFDRGAGRVQVDVASATGLVMHETAFRFLTADPDNGGDPKTLNVASYKNNNCVGTCSFQRKFTSVASVPVDYAVSLVGMTGTINPATFTASPGQTVTVDVEIDGGALASGVVSFGELVIAEEVVGLPTAITDDGYQSNDPVGNLSCAPLNVSGASAADAMSLELGIDHTWVEDLTVKLFNPNGDELTVLSRAAGAGGGFFNNSNLVSTSPITFSDAGVTDAELMGGDTDTNICEADGLCDYFPNPDVETSSLADFAAIVAAADPNGTWQLCAGDSAGGDTGTIQTASIRFNGVDVVTPPDLKPDLHLPLVITTPEEPEIDVTPTSLSATLDANTTTDVTLNVDNADSASADLNWVFGTGLVPGGTPFDYINQPDTGVGSGFLSGTFVDNAGNGVFSADDFTLTETAMIEMMRFEGFANGTTLDVQATDIRVFVYADNAGAPAGNPEDGLNSELFTISLPIGDPNLDVTDNNIAINVAGANGGAFELVAGTYWITVVVDNVGAVGGAGRWNWSAAGSTVAGGTAQVIGPQFGIADWSAIPTFLDPPNPDFEQLVFSISGSDSENCGAPWITTSSVGGVLAPGEDEDVTVTLDATGLAPGVYNATLCVESDDSDEPLVLVPVTMTVDALPDLIFADGFEAIVP